jgi:ferric-dicitrate binding protein FerR (iron transport regulator)
MLAEVREQMVYNAPPELGDLWTRFEKMWTQIREEQDEALAREMRKAQATKWQRRKAMQDLRAKAAWVGAVLLIAVWYSGLLLFLRVSLTYRGFW